MKRTATTVLFSVAMASLAVGCGPSASSKKDMSTLAAGAPPPPTGGGELDRKLTREAAKDFAEAVAYYNQQAESGWNEQTCQEAARRFISVADAHSKLVEARFNAGLSYQHCTMMKAAEEQYQAALKINPGHAASLSNLGEIYFAGGNETRAKQYWEQAVKADGKVVAARNNLGWLLIREIRESGGSKLKSLQPEVERHLSSALAVDNDNVEAYVLYSLLYMQGSERNRSRLTLAKLLLDKGEEINAGFAPLHNARGLLLLRQDNVPSALASFRQAVELDPRFVEARMNVGNIVLEFRKYAEAKEQFEAVLRLQPKSYDAMIGLGYAQRGLTELDAAEKSYESAKGLDSGRAEAYFNLGVLYKDFRANATQDLREAQKAYRTAALHFKQALAKGGNSLKKEAQQNIEDCEKNIKSLDEAIKFQNQMKDGQGAAPAPDSAGQRNG